MQKVAALILIFVLSLVFNSLALGTAIKTHRPVHLTLSFLGGYDTNIISKPRSDTLAAGLDNEKGATLSSSVRVDFTPRIEGPWLFIRSPRQ